MKNWLAILIVENFNEERFRESIYSILLQSNNHESNKLVILTSEESIKEIKELKDKFFEELIEIEIKKITNIAKNLNEVVESSKKNSVTILKIGQVLYPDYSLLESEISEKEVAIGQYNNVIFDSKDKTYIDSKILKRYLKNNARLKILFQFKFVDSQFLFSRSLFDSIKFDDSLISCYFYDLLLNAITKDELIICDIKVCEERVLREGFEEKEIGEMLKKLYSKNIFMKGGEIHEIHSIISKLKIDL